MAKIDRVEDLPDWFDLDKYHECKKFNAGDWYNCLSVRREFMCVLFLGLRHGFSVDEFYGESCGPQVLMRLDPLDWRAVRATHWGASEESKSPPDFPVRELEFVDLLFQRQSDFEDEAEGRGSRMAELWRLLDNHAWSEVMEKLDGVPVGSVGGRSETIKVDMAATDAVLIAAFSSWLKRARAQYPTVTSKRERPAYKDWASYGLLPYLDLMLWSKEIGIHIPHHIMAEAVGYRKGGDSFRKTVPKLADDLMQSLSELEALAAIEADPE